MPTTTYTQGTEKEVEVANWTKEQIDTEIKRLKSLGTSCLPIKVKNISFFNTAIVREDESFINRVECDTAFDFNRIEQILISEPIPCPFKSGFNYVHVILFCKSIPLIMPYLYNASYIQMGHDLRQWLFINNKLVSSRQSVDVFEEV